MVCILPHVAPYKKYRNEFQAMSDRLDRFVKKQSSGIKQIHKLTGSCLNTTDEHRETKPICKRLFTSYV